MKKTYDIVIVGAGIVGATAALALAKKTTLQIALLDTKTISPIWHKSQHDLRVSAISLASQRIFKNLQIWDSIATKRISSYQRMFVWDSESGSEIDFDGVMQHATMGYIIEESVIRTSIYESFADLSNLDVLAPMQLVSLQEKLTHIELITAKDEVIEARLVIAADGGHSWVRENANIIAESRDYEHTALVATVKTSLSHKATAWQRFLPQGPLAFLPLVDANSCSIVWSTTPTQAEYLLSLDDTHFQTELAAAFSAKLGDILHVSARASFHLQMQHVKNYVKPNLVLVGDAAHTIHPLAGQGVNMGLLDVASLVDVITQAISKQRVFFSLPTLRRYERARKADNAAMLLFVDSIKAIFETSNPIVKTLRGAGLHITNKMNFVKNFFANYAAGNRAEMPLLTRESLCK
jgi:2-octaprenylphenol hydroxylase